MNIVTSSVFSFVFVLFILMEVICIKNLLLILDTFVCGTVINRLCV